MRAFLISFVVFSLVGGLLASWLAPGAISWYFEPPVEIGVNCRPATEWAMHKLQLTQTAGFVGGGILGTIVYFLFNKRNQSESSKQL